MRRLFTIRHETNQGVTKAAVRWRTKSGACRRIIHGIYGEGPEDPTPVDRALAMVLRSDGVACAGLAGVVHDLDGIALAEPYVRRQQLPEDRIVAIGGVRVTSVLQTLADLARTIDDDTWEQALECGLRRRQVTVAAIEAERERMSALRMRGAARMRRVLSTRPPGAAATGSRLETMMVQLARLVPGLPPPVRQYRIVNEHQKHVALVDLCWPEIGLFIELDGEHHKDQPRYDARRETAVVAATGWLCGRFTWTEVVRLPRTTAKRLAQLVEQARRRPVAS